MNFIYWEGFQVIDVRDTRDLQSDEGFSLSREPAVRRIDKHFEKGTIKDAH